jgi:iron(III) transport system substrate-binding protein
MGGWRSSFDFAAAWRQATRVSMRTQPRSKPARAIAALAMIAAASLAPTGNVGAASVDEIANYTGADRQAMLEDGAKREGAVMVYTTGAQTDPLFKRFMEKYPFVRLQAFRPGGADAVSRRIFEEHNAGLHVADVVFVESGGLRPLRAAGILQPYTSPEFQHYKPEAIEPNRLWAIDKESYVGLGYNTRVYQQTALPTSYDDLLDPKWKGKFALSQNSTLVNWIGAVVLSKGEDFIRKFGRQEPTVYAISGPGFSSLVASGETPISPTVYDGHMFAKKKAGGTVDWQALGATFSNIGGDALTKDAPHPHAAMLLIDFMLSKEGQAMYQELGYQSARLDMQNRFTPEKVLYLALRPNYEQDFEYWSHLSIEIFGQGRKTTEKGGE